MNNEIIKNKSGFTLIELLVSIAVSSVLIVTLVQVLMLSIAAKQQLEQDMALTDESFFIAQQIKLNVFELEAQELELISDTVTSTVIEIRHLYDFSTNDQNIIEPDYSNPVTDTLILDKVNQAITYNGTQLNSANIRVLDVSAIELIPIDTTTCDFSVGPCDEGIIKLTLTIEVILPNGQPLPAQTFVTTILV
jgi:prepilin-type N-terminal cleavage/methylation domain-containing protein